MIFLLGVGFSKEGCPYQRCFSFISQCNQDPTCLPFQQACKLSCQHSDSKMCQIECMKDKHQKGLLLSNCISALQVKEQKVDRFTTCSKAICSEEWTSCENDKCRRVIRDCTYKCAQDQFCWERCLSKQDRQAYEALRCGLKASCQMSSQEKPVESLRKNE